LSNDGFGISWNRHKKGVIVGATGTDIALWNINDAPKKGIQIEPTTLIEQSHS